MSSEDEDMDVIFDEDDEDQEFEEPLFIEEEDSDRVIWDENGLNEDFDREAIIND